MNSPTIRRLLIALGTGIALWAVLALVRTLREDRLRGLALTRVDTATVDTVTLARRGDSSRLVRGTEGHWTANGFAADTARIHELLRALADTTMWSEQVATNASSHVRLGVDGDSGRRVRVVTGARSAFDFVVGRRTADYNGVFVRRATEDVVYALHAADLASALTRSADDWRDKRIAVVPADSVGSIALRRGARTVTLRRSGAAWTLEGAPADSAAVASLLDAYRELSATGFATPAQADSARLRNPRLAVAIRSRSGGRLLDLAMDSLASGILARAEANPVVYLLDAWQLSRIFPPDSALKRKSLKKA